MYLFIFEIIILTQVGVTELEDATTIVCCTHWKGANYYIKWTHE